MMFTLNLVLAALLLGQGIAIPLVERAEDATTTSLTSTGHQSTTSKFKPSTTTAAEFTSFIPSGGVTSVSFPGAGGPTTIDSTPGGGPTTVDSSPGGPPTTIDSTPGSEPTTIDSTPGSAPTTIDSTPGNSPTTVDSTPGNSPTTIDSTPGSGTTTVLGPTGSSVETSVPVSVGTTTVTFLPTVSTLPGPVPTTRTFPYSPAAVASPTLNG